MNKKRVISTAFMCLIGIGIVSLYCGLTVRQYTIKSAKLGQGKALRLIMLSDLHSYVYGADQSPLLRAVCKAQPDIIVLCGDIVDDKKSLKGAREFLQQITDLAPCYYVSGNHEHWCENPEQVFAMIEQYGIHVLHNQRVQIEHDGNMYMICGVDDPASNGDGTAKSYGDSKQYRQILSEFSDLPEESFNILLAHRPEYIEEYASQPFDLALCGHAHGGQWRIPYLLNGLVAPNQGFFPQYAGGRYDLGTFTEIVGRGLVRDWKPRIFNPPEILVVNIVPTDG